MAVIHEELGNVAEDGESRRTRRVITAFQPVPKVVEDHHQNRQTESCKRSCWYTYIVLQQRPDQCSQRRYSPLSSRTSSWNIWFGNMKEIYCFDYPVHNNLLFLWQRVIQKLAIYYQNWRLLKLYVWHFLCEFANSMVNTASGGCDEGAELLFGPWLNGVRMALRRGQQDPKSLTRGP